MRRWSVVLLLGAVGAAMLIAASSVKGVRLFAQGPVQIAPFFLMAIAAPALLRAFGLGASFRQMFVNCAVVGATMGGAFHVWQMVSVAGPMPWYAYVLTSMFLLACVLFGSALAATVGAEPSSDGPSRLRTALRGPVWGATAFAIAYAIGQLRFLAYGAAHVSRVPAAESVMAILCWAAYLAFKFSAVAILVHYPIILAVRRLSARRLVLGLVGALLFPIPWEMYALVRGNPQLHLLNLLHASRLVDLIPLLLPLMVGGAVIGWVLAARPRREAPVRPLAGAATT